MNDECEEGGVVGGGGEGGGGADGGVWAYWRRRSEGVYICGDAGITIALSPVPLSYHHHHPSLVIHYSKKRKQKHLRSPPQVYRMQYNIT